jgi:hypothetical protein
MLQIERLSYTETLEVVITNINARQYKFSDNEKTIDKAIVTGIAVSTEALGKSFNNNDLLSNVELKKCFLNLATPKNELPFKNLPLELLMNNNNIFTFIKPTEIDLRKSFVEIPNCQNLGLPVNNNNRLAIVFTITYLEKTDAVKLGYIEQE